jgi:hypothetical protein
MSRVSSRRAGARAAGALTAKRGKDFGFQSHKLVRLSENRKTAFALAGGELLRVAAKANEAGLELHLFGVFSAYD